MSRLRNYQCSVEGCARPGYARGWCARHYDRWFRNGHLDPIVVRDTGTPAERLKAKCRPLPNGCWEWQASTNAKGYGVFRLDGGMTLAHRAAYLLFVGPVPEGKEIDHLCRNRRCVNPEHLEAVTHLVNVHRGSRYIHGRYSKVAYEGARI